MTLTENKKKKNYPVLPPIRCSKEDKDIIKAKAFEAGLSLSEYVRRQSLDGKIIIRRSSQTLSFEMIHELKKIGNNINQIAKNMNIFGHPDTGDINRIKGKLDSILDNVIKQM